MRCSQGLLLGDNGVSDDSRGYYAALGLSPGASITVIRAVYRQLAKECHPDTANCLDGGERFRRITEAYDALSNPTFKSSYDREPHQPEQGASAHSEQSFQVDPVLCQVCGKVTAQPRRIAFWRVTGFILASHRNPVQHVYCSECASKEQWKSTLWTSLLGWWGIPWGPAWSIKHGVQNAAGGSREAEVDEALMWQNAVAFSMRGEGAIAVGLSNILRKSDNAEIGQQAAQIIRFFSEKGINPATKLKDVWKHSFLRTATLIAAAFMVPAAAVALVFADFPNLQASGASDLSTPPAIDDAFDETFGPTAEQPASTEAATPIVQDAPLVARCDSPPSNGEVLVDHRPDDSVGHQLEIDNGTAGDAIIKIREVGADNSLASFFVARGQTATLKNIPDGDYTIQYAIGEKMAENCRSFVDDGTASASEFPGPEKLETRYAEELGGTRITRGRLSYTLYSVPGGNVRPSSINMEEFDNP